MGRSGQKWDLAIFCLFEHTKYGHVGCPWKDLVKCSSDPLVSGQKLWPNFISRIIKLVPHLSRVQNICLWKVWTQRQQNRQIKCSELLQVQKHTCLHKCLWKPSLFVANLNITGNRLKQDYLRMNNSTG